ncbi:hypothetical protein JCM10450v2_006210 [Rhodotorula kratochvilovae]
MSTPGVTISPSATPASRRYQTTGTGYATTSTASRRRRRRLLLLLGLLTLVVLLTVIIVPPSVVLTRNSNASADDREQVYTTVVDGVTLTQTRAFVTTTLTDGVVVVLETATNIQTQVATITYTASNGVIGVETLTLTSLDLVTVLGYSTCCLRNLVAPVVDVLILAHLEHVDDRRTQLHNVAPSVNEHDVLDQLFRNECFAQQLFDHCVVELEQLELVCGGNYVRDLGKLQPEQHDGGGVLVYLCHDELHLAVFQLDLRIADYDSAADLIDNEQLDYDQRIEHDDHRRAFYHDDVRRRSLTDDDDDDADNHDAGQHNDWSDLVRSDLHVLEPSARLRAGLVDYHDERWWRGAAYHDTSHDRAADFLDDDEHDDPVADLGRADNYDFERQRLGPADRAVFHHLDGVLVVQHLDAALLDNDDEFEHEQHTSYPGRR